MGSQPAAGTTPVIPGRSNHKPRIRHHECRYDDRWLMEAMFCRLKDFRRVAKRYPQARHKPPVAAVVAFWL